MRSCSLSGAPQKPAHSAIHNPTCVIEYLQRIPMLLRQPRNMTRLSCVSTNRIAITALHESLAGSTCRPSTTPIIAMIKSDIHVAFVDSRHFVNFDDVRLLCSTITPLSHSTIVSMLRGKRKISRGKSPINESANMPSVTDPHIIYVRILFCSLFSSLLFAVISWA